MQIYCGSESLHNNILRYLVFYVKVSDKIVNLGHGIGLLCRAFVVPFVYFLAFLVYNITICWCV